MMETKEKIEKTNISTLQELTDFYNKTLDYINFDGSFNKMYGSVLVAYHDYHVFLAILSKFVSDKELSKLISEASCFDIDENYNLSFKEKFLRINEHNDFLLSNFENFVFFDTRVIYKFMNCEFNFDKKVLFDFLKFKFNNRSDHDHDRDGSYHTNMVTANFVFEKVIEKYIEEKGLEEDRVINVWMPCSGHGNLAHEKIIQRVQEKFNVKINLFLSTIEFEDVVILKLKQEFGEINKNSKIFQWDFLECSPFIEKDVKMFGFPEDLLLLVSEKGKRLIIYDNPPFKGQNTDKRKSKDIKKIVKYSTGKWSQNIKRKYSRVAKEMFRLFFVKAYEICNDVFIAFFHTHSLLRGETIIFREFFQIFSGKYVYGIGMRSNKCFENLKSIFTVMVTMWNCENKMKYDPYHKYEINVFDFSDELKDFVFFNKFLVGNIKESEKVQTYFKDSVKNISYDIFVKEKPIVAKSLYYVASDLSNMSKYMNLYVSSNKDKYAQVINSHNVLTLGLFFSIFKVFYTTEKFIDLYYLNYLESVQDKEEFFTDALILMLFSTTGYSISKNYEKIADQNGFYYEFFYADNNIKDCSLLIQEEEKRKKFLEHFDKEKNEFGIFLSDFIDGKIKAPIIFKGSYYTIESKLNDLSRDLIKKTEEVYYTYYKIYGSSVKCMKYPIFKDMVFALEKDKNKEIRDVAESYRKSYRELARKFISDSVRHKFMTQYFR
ncbi:MAG: hypothetical protein NZZ41_07245 [Candidatus Dojkabacteria bacterium]|nr:hypothetical protein [Candidatus Dojkabacteria bacterium]